MMDSVDFIHILYVNSSKSYDKELQNDFSILKYDVAMRYARELIMDGLMCKRAYYNIVAVEKSLSGETIAI